MNMSKKKNNEAAAEAVKEENELNKEQAQGASSSTCCEEADAAGGACEEAPCADGAPADEEKGSVDIPSELSALKAENESLKSKLAKEKDDYVRLMADFTNLRRHAAQEKLDLVATASAETIKGLLPVLDDCERALDILEKSEDEAAKEGTALIYNKLMEFLKTKGLETVKAKGERFDTDFHEAVAQFPAGEENKGLVFDVVQTGYLLSGKVLRYAKVVVGI